jgi:hypothetical protein
MAGLSAWYLLLHPIALVIGGAVFALVAVIGRLGTERLASQAREREGEDIGTFARAFDRHSPTFDPWVVRAVWDGLSPWTTLRDGRRLPLRPDDDLAVLGCVDDDLDDLAEEVTIRTRRSMANPEANPLHGRVRTVGDLVAFVSFQPREPAA